MSLWVIKIGTSLLRGDKSRSTQKVIRDLCFAIADAKKRGEKIVLVTSGAVGLGCDRLEIKERPSDVVFLQALAAIGQGYLMLLYQEGMKLYDHKVAQILLTRTDLSSRISYQNASKTLLKLLDWNVIPIVNENDTLSAEELKYGDNDTLSALVATAINADQLILLTDVDKLYSTDPRKDSKAKPITDVRHPKELNIVSNGDSGANSWGKGGIKTKLGAARIATESGITVQLADGRDPKVLCQLLKGERGGTVFHPHPKPLKNKKSWLAHALYPLGDIYADDGACNAIKKEGASLLLVGITKVSGSFLANQPVRILSKNGKELAKGISSISSERLEQILNQELLQEKSQVVIHRDVLILTSNDTS